MYCISVIHRKINNECNIVLFSADLLLDECVYLHVRYDEMKRETSSLYVIYKLISLFIYLFNVIIIILFFFIRMNVL